MKDCSDEETDRLARAAKQMLDHSAQDLDPWTIGRLQRARLQALDKASRRRPWLVWAWGTAAFASLVAVVSVMWWTSSAGLHSSNLPLLEDLELVRSSENLELSEDLDFYDWLAEGLLRPDSATRWLLASVLWAATGTAVALAQGDRAGVPWNQLTPGEQQLLQRFSETWDQFPPRKQERLRRGAQQWGTMTSEERQEAKQRFKQWRSLPPEQQQQLRERYQRYRQWPPEQRESVRNARQWFKSLPPEERKALREKFRTMTPEERKAYKRELRRRYESQGSVIEPHDQSTPPTDHPASGQ